MEDAAEKATDETDEDEAVVEDVTESDKPPKTKEIIVEAQLLLGDVDQYPVIDVTIDGADE